MEEVPTPAMAARRLLIVQGAMSMAPYMLVPVALYIGPVFQGPQSERVIDILFWIVFAMALGAVPIAFVLYRNANARIAAAGSERERISAINGRAIVLTALVEAVALFAAVNILLSGFDWRTLPGLAGPIVLLALLFPRPEMFSGETASRLDKYS